MIFIIQQDKLYVAGRLNASEYFFFFFFFKKGIYWH